MDKIAEITDIIPHRPPMLLVDEVLQCTDDQIEARKTFDANEFFFQGHYPGHPIVPGVILCECGVQAGAILVAKAMNIDLATSDRIPVLVRMNKVKFRQAVHPGDTIAIAVALKEVVSGAYFLSAKLQLGSVTAATLDFTCTLSDKA